uniref:Solute carrier family 41 member n=1 Tax=Sinocyclocheilus grahami TaxID=75366 RepID=A0A672QQJ2_SINGR
MKNISLGFFFAHRLTCGFPLLCLKGKFALNGERNLHATQGQREEDALLENASQSNESDDTSTDQSPVPPAPLKETSFSIGLQVLFPFLLAGFGTVAAGMVLDIVQVSKTQLLWIIELNQ